MARHNSYPPPTGAPPACAPFACRVLPSVVPQPLPTTLPSLPTPQRPSPFPDFTLTTHLTPWARPRASRTGTRGTVRPPYPPTVEHEESTPQAKAQRAQEVKDFTEKLWAKWEETQGEPSWKGSADEPPLWAVVNRFLRKQGTGDGATLLFASGNGYPKETWEPLIDMLLQRYPDIDEILVWESFNQGDAALVNAPNLGDSYDWADCARDVLQFLTYHRPLTRERAPVHLPLHKPERKPRRVIGVGHSLGGELLARTAIHGPEHFWSLLLIDPIILPEVSWSRKFGQAKRWDFMRKSTLSRRCVWPSITDARESLRRTAFRNWHPAMLEGYIPHAFYSPPSLPEGAVALKQSPFDEVQSFYEPPGPSETWHLLPTLDERVEIRWVMGSQPESFTAGVEWTRHMVWRRPANSSNVVVEGVSHFVPQEAPEQVADEIAAVLVRRFGPPRTYQDVRARL